MKQQPQKFDAIIIGAGISGLSVAAYLSKAGKRVKVLEKADCVGGTMQTIQEQGYLIDYGPNTVVLNNTRIFDMISFGGLDEEMLPADACASKRFVIRNGRPQPLPTSPPAFFISGLYSPGAKLRLLREPFIGKGPEGETVADFVKRRLGDEFFNYAVDPFISGVYAGDPHRLSIQWAVPKIHILEEKYGGLIKGLFLGAKERKKKRLESGESDKTTARICNFRKGITALPEGMAASLGEAVELNCDIASIIKGEDGYTVSCKQSGEEKNFTATSLVLSVPTDPLDELMTLVDSDYKGGMASMPYAPVAQVFLGYKRSDVTHALDGFGFLCPTVEKRKILGALMNASMFPGRAPEGYTGLTCFVGGMQHPEHAVLEEDKLIGNAHSELQELLGIQKPPSFSLVKRYPKAIPQYHLDYPKYLTIIESFEAKHPGLYLSGNFRGGISIGDCISQAAATADKIIG
ncbi:MAG: protoporphyrinogen oxidase [Fibrobacteria bacterium]|nr:protoporphyrinogen oxidase [Fibrobacteria bacterium]